MCFCTNLKNWVSTGIWGNGSSTFSQTGNILYVSREVFTSEMGSLTPQLSNITIDKNKIIEAIHDLSTHSAPGPDGDHVETLSEPLMIFYLTHSLIVIISLIF